MGRKHQRTGKYIFFFIAGLIFFSLISCAAIKETDQRHQADRDLMHGQKLLKEGDYQAALKINEEVLSAVKGFPGDRALFNMGLIYAHYDNPARDFSKSIHYFRRILNEYPGSSLELQAKLWVDTLNAIVQLKQDVYQSGIVNDKIKNENDRMKYVGKYQRLSLNLFDKNEFERFLKENGKILKDPDRKNIGDIVLFNMGLIYAHHDNPGKNYQISLEYFSKLVTEYPHSRLINEAKIWMNVLNVIEKAKQVDIEIEKKKKEMTQ